MATHTSNKSGSNGTSQKAHDALIGKEEIAWLEKYLSTAAPSGNEQRGQRMWLDYIKPYVDDTFVNVYGCAAAIINPDAEFKVIVDAHADEIAWYVNTITSEGFIHVEDTGGSDPGIAPSQRVNIHTAKGTLNGVFGWPAIHVRDKKDDKAKDDTLFIDCGCSSREEVEKLGIKVGDLVTYDSGFSTMNENHFVGRAQDNKMGGFMLARVARMIKESDDPLPIGVYFVNVTQEEVGTKGAEMMAYKINPDCVLVTDVTHATNSPMMDKNKEGNIKLGEGPVITKSAPVHNKLRNLLIDTAEKHKIPYQLSVASKSTGTDTDAYAYARGGIPAALISLPLRYMHTTVETTHRDDIENSIRLLYHTLRNITPKFDFKYF